jgi:hypothetical protein
VKTLQNRGQAIWQILGQQPETEMFGGCSVQPDRRNGSIPSASRPRTIPARTSPEPAVANMGGALLLITCPFGDAITVSLPFRITTAPHIAAAFRARDSRSPLISKSRANSPSCGVSTHGPTIAYFNDARSCPNRVSASASSTVGRPFASAALRVSLMTPAPGPINIAETRRSRSRRSNSAEFAIR